jgi:hypothetical protein
VPCKAAAALQSVQASYTRSLRPYTLVAQDLIHSAPDIQDCFKPPTPVPKSAFVAESISSCSAKESKVPLLLIASLDADAESFDSELL